MGESSFGGRPNRFKQKQSSVVHVDLFRQTNQGKTSYFHTFATNVCIKIFNHC